MGNSEGFGQQRVKVQTGHHGVKYFLPKNADKWAKNTAKWPKIHFPKLSAQAQKFGILMKKGLFGDRKII